LNSKISDKDKRDWENFLTRKDTLPNKDFELSKEERIKTKSFDLHGFTLEEANFKMTELIKTSYTDGVKKLIIVTGKGLHSNNEKDPYVSKKLGILKYSVPEFIRNSKELMKLIYEIKDASVEDGGSGAFYIFLKKSIK
jgi:DNA-nicking Smr family endonuclease